jgi:hypothetical protein
VVISANARVTVSLCVLDVQIGNAVRPFVEAAAAPATVDGKSLPDMPLALRIEVPGRSEETLEP